MQTLRDPTDVTLDEYVSDRFLCSGGSSGYEYSISCKGLDSHCIIATTVWPTWELHLVTGCLFFYRRLWWIPVPAKKKALLSGQQFYCLKKPLCKQRCQNHMDISLLFYLQGGGTELGHNGCMQPSQHSSGNGQEGQAASWCSRLSHRRVQDNAVAEGAPGGGDPVPAWP